jgi:hypothetical protein
VAAHQRRRHAGDTRMMRSAKSVGRIIGILLLVQAAAGFVVNFVLMGPVMTVPPGFLVNAAGSALQVRVAVLLGLATGALTVGIAIAAWPVFRRYSQTMALWFLALSVVGFSLLALENISVLTMLSLSQEYAKASATQELFQTIGLLVRSARTSAHYTNLLMTGAMVFVFYSVLWRFALVPRALAAFGLAAVMLQIIAVTMPLFGYRIVFLLILPLGLSQLTLALWLMAKGFEERHHLVRAKES